MPAPRYDSRGKLSRTYRKWSSMVQRCTNPKHLAFDYYGGSGVQVAKTWRNFDAFHADMGECPEGYWIDRIDNSKGYEPGNCRWVTPRESARNRKQKPPVPGSIRNQAKLAGLPYHVLYARLRSGLWSTRDALATPVHGRNPGIS